MAKPFTVAEIREAYLAFFAEKKSVRYASASLVPENDPTTLFTVAGMSQFKDMFLGRGTHPFTRAVTVQKCIRTNDILNVGRTARHHTFFEMLGNFSFNDYFKSEAIHWAWEFLTQRLELDPARLSISVHRIDDEAYRIWREEIGIPVERIFKLGDADNFWPANAPSEGPEGPGGCCSEIFWDHRINSDPKDNLTSSTGRFVEIWNLVFPEFNVRKPKADGSPNLENLGRRNIDTGSGLERVAAVMQGVYNNFDIDVFQTIVKQVCIVSGCTYDRGATLGDKTPAAETNALIRRIADHVRAVTFCIADGALPGNSDRGYIVRRLIRRATLDLDKLGIDESRLFEIVPAVVEAMGTAYPEVVRRQDLARETLKSEEQLFRRTLRKGLELFQRSLERFRGGRVFSGDDAFDLVTTHGFPKEVIAELAGNEGLSIDEARFQVRWDEHTRISNTKQVEVFTSTALQQAKPSLGVTPFVGYTQLRTETEISLLEMKGAMVTQAAVGSKVRFALKATPFYAESGGQESDRGQVSGPGFTIQVNDVQKDEGLVIHTGEVTAGTAKPGPVTAIVDASLRQATTRHHSATHLMHSALGRVLGDHVEQQGSRVEPTQLRFDFNHTGAMTRDQIKAVQSWVLEAIAAGHATDIRELPIAEAKAAGAKAQFGEKYGDKVRVVTFGSGDISRELCGGCHVANTSDIAAFRIIKEEASSAGIRRIVAVAGDAARTLEREELEVANRCGRLVGLNKIDDASGIEAIAQLFKATLKELPQRLEQLTREVAELSTRLGISAQTPSGDLMQRVEQFQEEAKRLRKADDQRKAQAASGAIDDVLAQEKVVAGVPLIIAQIDGLDGKALRQLCDLARSKRPSLCLVLVSVVTGDDGIAKVGMVAAVSADLIAKGLAAGTLIASVAPLVGGRGGGKPDFAQAGGTNAAGIPAALAASDAWVRSHATAGEGLRGSQG
jgi:alanyl-tRNA synthetase